MNLKIGVIGRPNISEKTIFFFVKPVTDVISKYNCIPVGIIPPNSDINSDLTSEEKLRLHQIIDCCDGIILQGGSDYYPYDIEAVKYINEKNMPVLGICLGMQTLGVVSGGYLEQVSNHCVTGVNHVHLVDIREDSKLYQILKKKQIMVNSRHKEMIVNPGYNIVGYADNVIEAIEDPNKDFNIGLQWHPEDLINEMDSINIFNSFFTNCEKYHQEKQ